MPSSQLGGVPGRHRPVPWSQNSMPLQMFPSSQLTALPVQMPLSQVSFTVHGLRSSHGPVRTTDRQPRTGSHVSVVQGLPSSQMSGDPAMHAPLVGSQVSTPLHAFPSSHRTGVPVHVPSMHMSFRVQALPSLHGLL